MNTREKATTTASFFRDKTEGKSENWKKKKMNGNKCFIPYANGVFSAMAKKKLLYVCGISLVEIKLSVKNLFIYVGRTLGHTH